MELSQGQIIQKPNKQELSSLFMTHRLNVMHAPVKFHKYIPYGLGVIAWTWFTTVQSAQPYYVSFSLANEERINFLASSALFPRSFHALSTIISRLSHATNPTATRNVKFACHSIVPRSPRATGKIASRYTLQPIATCLHFILDQYRIRSSDPNVFTRVR